MNSKTNSTFQAPIFSALALAFASFGDAFLYPFLPLHGERLGMSVAWIGILLSINRFARIFTNALIARACATFGFRSITIIGVAVAIISTAGYGFATGIFTWVLFRISWGLSYSVLRISAISYSLDHERQGFSLGLSKSVQEAGPMITLIVAPPLLFQLDTQIIFYILAIASLPGLYFAFRLPQKFSETTPFTFKRFVKIPSTFNLLTFCSAILVEGIVVVTLGMLFLKYNDSISILSASILAASYLGYRRICLITFSPFGGWIADKYGLEKVFVISVVMVLAGMTFLTAGFIELGAIVVFAFYSILSALTPGAASAKGKHSLDAVSENATWRDIGAALGTLTGGLLLESDFIITVLLSGTVLMAVLFLYYANVTNKAFKQLMI
ncbi:MFS transporter [Chryseolinea sp. H1M3-3]|uniref:MFS transporter n=1 Tax=Chryseolinea sp. H1M3-3 TaxID=3034144 RepID=UPI0023ED7C9D|nr:MFS transporter [Chryseolinea sp. H1M3-3]